MSTKTYATLLDKYDVCFQLDTVIFALLPEQKLYFTVSDGIGPMETFVNNIKEYVFPSLRETSDHLHAVRPLPTHGISSPP